MARQLSVQAYTAVTDPFAEDWRVVRDLSETVDE